MRNKWMLLPAVVCMLLVDSCTDAGLCEDATHAVHEGNVRMNYVWPEGTTPPDSMTIMAVRVVNHRKFGMIVSTENLRGHYFYNAPANVTEWVDPDAVDPEPKPEPDPTVIGVVVDPEKPNNGGEGSVPNPNDGEESESTPTEDIVVDHFTLPAGTYNFFTMETDTSNVYYRNVNEYLNAAGTGLQYSEIGLEYKVYDLDDEKLDVPGKNYQDYNQGFKYVRTECPAIYVDRKELLEIGQNIDMNIQFQPRMLTQNVDIYFNIKKELADGTPFVVDSVIAEISGIPSKVGVFDGHLYLAKTRKMLFRTTLENTNGNKIDDTTTNEDIRVHGNINVLSILHSENPANVSGPGIMQIAIYSHTEQVDEAGVLRKGSTRRVQGRLNLYDSLVKADLIAYSDDYQYATKRVDHAVLDIETTAVVSAKGVQSGSSQGGINDWTFCSDVSTDENGEPLEL